MFTVDVKQQYNYNNLNGCVDIIDEKVFRNYGRTEGGRTSERYDGPAEGYIFRCYVIESSDFLFLFPLLYPDIVDCNWTWKNCFESFHLMHWKSPLLNNTCYHLTI